MIRRLSFFLLSIVALFTACSDNDSFSANPSSQLTFSVDTLQLDTLFSNIPSSTYTFWVFNRTGDGLRINSVRLERGNQSGFRANVDGTFLDPVANNIEVRKGDSLRVFVEVTPQQNNAIDPQLIEDQLVFTLESGVIQRVNLRAYSWDAVSLTNLQVTNDTIIESSRPVVVYGNGITVSEGTTLTIRNTTLYFHDGAGINVAGTLVAENSMLRGDRLDHYNKVCRPPSSSDPMEPINVYDQYFEAECEFNGVDRHAVRALLVADSHDRRRRYDVALSFFPHEDAEDFRITYDAYFERNVYDASGRRSKKREAEIMETFRDVADSLASENGGKVFWDRPLNEARRA